VHYRFLCPGHRHWLTRHPENVLPVWKDAMEASHRQVCKGQWQNALKFAGTAFEAARLMVNNPQYCDRLWIQRWSASEALLRMVVQGLSGIDRVAVPASASVH